MEKSLFEGLQKADFEAYAPEKWRSNLYSKERLQTKEKLLRLARYINYKLNSLSNSTKLEIWSSDHTPTIWNNYSVDSQWICFSKDYNNKSLFESIFNKEKSLKQSLIDPSPTKRHAFIAIVLNYKGIEFGFRIHYEAKLDRTNMNLKLAIKENLDSFISLLYKAPEEITIGLLTTKSGKESECGKISKDELTEYSEKFNNTPDSYFIVRHFIPESIVTNYGNKLLNIAERDMVYLFNILNFIAWSPENNYLPEELLKTQRENNRVIQPTPSILIEKKGGEEKKNPPDIKKEYIKVDNVTTDSGWYFKVHPPKISKAVSRYKGSSKKEVNQKSNFLYSLNKETTTKSSEFTNKTEDEPKSIPKNGSSVRFKPGMNVKIINGPFNGKYGKIEEVGEKEIKIIVGSFRIRIEPDKIVLADGLPNE